MMLHGETAHDHAPDYDLDNFHIHASLSMYVDGALVQIPANIGIDNSGFLDFVHTHEADNVIHLHNVNGQSPPGFITLDEFFDVWREKGGLAGNNPDSFLSAARLLDNEVDGDHSLRMYVNGIRTMDFENYVIHDGDQIVLSYSSRPIVTLETNFGPIVMEMLPDLAPITVANFANYLNPRPSANGNGDVQYYVNSIFHRSVPGFVIQGGGFTTPSLTFMNTNQFGFVPTDPPIQNEFGVSNTRGTVAMAKLGGDPNSATSQFFVNLGDNSSNLDNQNGGFTVFGNVLDMTTVDLIASLATGNFGGAFTNLPLTAESELVVIEAVEGEGLIRGIKFEDLNFNGVQDVGENGLQGFTIFSDENGNGILDDGELATQTGPDGRYLLMLPAGMHLIREVHQTGFLQTVPSDAHTVTIAIGEELDDLDFGNVRVPAPAAIDLLPESDTGESSGDNITNLNNSSTSTRLSFRVTDVDDGALVRLYSGGTQIGSATASGGMAVVTTNGVTPLSGVVSIVATQAIDGVEGLPSLALEVMVDTAVSPITSTPPTSGMMGQLLSYAVQHQPPELHSPSYSLEGAPSGATISPAGVLNWTPTGSQIGNHSFTILATDVAGNELRQQLNISVTGNPVVNFRLVTTDLNEVPIDTVMVGDQFLLQVYVEDGRGFQAQGIFAAFLDVLPQNNLVSFLGLDRFGEEFQVLPSAASLQQGLFDEVGALATDSFNGPGDGEFLLVSVLMHANIAGQETLVGNPADMRPAHDILLFGPNDPVDVNLVNYGSTTLNIELSFGANGDLFNFDEDSKDNVLNVLDNDTQLPGSSGELTIAAVGETNHGGDVEIAEDGKTLIYSPAPDFFGVETFTYDVTDGTGTGTATVVVQVFPVNDDPTAVDDTPTVNEDSSENFLDLIANDLIAPDENETLRIVAVGAQSAGGMVSIGPGGTHVLYTPAGDFFGTETFTYTISDGHGGTSQALVSVEVVPANDNPVANPDSFTIAEDSNQIVLPVLNNDNTGSDTNETLMVVGFQTPNQGGTVSISDDGTALIYTPATNFFGNEVFLYTISDGNGGEATGMVSLDITAENDPPTAIDDSLTATKDIAAQTLDVLVNDSSAPDAGEALSIVDVSQVSPGTVVDISGDGKTILYTPAPGFTGFDTFTYTIADGNGGESEATVTVEVLDYIPGSLSGTVFFDVNNNAIKDPLELPITNVTITLTGTDIFGGSVEMTQQTGPDGSYHFVNLAPGNYLITEEQPEFLLDGRDTIGDQGGDDSVNDQFSIELEQGTDGTGNNFGERGRRSAYISGMDFLSSTPEQSVLAVARENGDPGWSTIEGAWNGFVSAELRMSPGEGMLELRVVDEHSGMMSASISMVDGRHVQMLGQIGDSHLVRIVGSLADFDFQVISSAAESSGAAEGEPLAATVTATPSATVADIGEGEAPTTHSVLATPATSFIATAMAAPLGSANSMTTAAPPGPGMTATLDDAGLALAALNLLDAESDPASLADDGLAADSPPPALASDLADLVDIALADPDADSFDPEHWTPAADRDDEYALAADILFGQDAFPAELI